MTLPNQTGTNRAGAKQGFSVGVLEVAMPAAVSATSGAATLNQGGGLVTSESITTAAAATYTLTLTNSLVDANTLVFAQANLGTSTQGTPSVTSIANAAGSVVIKVKNIDATNAFNGTIVVGFFLVRKAPASL